MYPVDWTKVDWALSNTALSKTLNVSPEVIAYHRPKGRSPLTPHSRFPINWDDVDWDLPNNAIACLFGVSDHTVAKHRPSNHPSKIHGWEHRSKTTRGERYEILSSNPDKSNHELARVLNLHPQTIARLRREFGLPSPPKYSFHLFDWDFPNIALSKIHGVPECAVASHRPSDHPPLLTGRQYRTKHLQESRIKLMSLHTDKTNDELSSILKIAPNYLGRLRRRYGLSGPRLPRPIKHPWHLFNWDLPNQDLSDIWGISHFNVAAQRWKFKHHSARWYKNQTNKPTEYYHLLNQEREKAASYYKTKS